MDMPPITLPPPIDGTPTLSPVRPPAGSPNDPAAQSQALAAALEKAASEPVPIRREVAELVFLNGQVREKTVPLEYPFTWRNTSYHSLSIRRLSAALYGAWADDVSADTDDLYGVMTGLPGAVIRAIDVDDRRALAEAALDFLPRALRRELESSVNANDGAATSGT